MAPWVQNSNGALSMLVDRRYMLTVKPAEGGWAWRVSERYPWQRERSGVVSGEALAKWCATIALGELRAPNAPCDLCGKLLTAHESHFDGPGVAGRGMSLSCAEVA